MEINKQFIDSMYEARPWYSFPAKKLLELVKEKNIKVSPNNAVKVHDVLVEVKNTLSLYGVAEQHLLTAKLNKINIKEKD